jgi:hypothetical protein
MHDIHYDYTVDEINKNLILLEAHGKNYQCPECMKKHLLAIEGLSEEGILMTDVPEERKKFIDLADWARKMRLSLGGKREHYHPTEKSLNINDVKLNISLKSNRGKIMVDTKEIMYVTGSQFVGRGIQEGLKMVDRPIVAGVNLSTVVNIGGGLAALLATLWRGTPEFLKLPLAVIGSKMLVDEIVDQSKKLAGGAGGVPTFVPTVAPRFIAAPPAPEELVKVD